MQAAAARQDVQSPTPQSARTLTRTKPEFVLPGSQLANKQVVTRTMGRILGVVDYLLADPNTCRVVALTFKDADDILPGDPPKQIGLMSLKQISDVLLVHDDRALLQQQLTVGLGYVKIVGTVVKSGDGKVLGKVQSTCTSMQGVLHLSSAVLFHAAMSCCVLSFAQSQHCNKIIPCSAL